MKATIKLLQHKLAKFVKYQIADTKRGVDMAKAKKQIEIFHILEKHIGSFHGVELHKDDIVVQAITGSYKYEPNTIFIDGKIVVNTAFESVPTDYQEAIFFHELAHIQKNHRLIHSYTQFKLVLVLDLVYKWNMKLMNFLL